MTATSAPAHAAPDARVHRAEAAMVLVVLIWGANFSFIKAAIAEIPPFAFAGLRFSLATVLLVGLVRWREGGFGFPPGTFWPLVGLGLAGNTLYQTFFMLGLPRTSVASSALILATTPPLVALAGAVSGVERLTRPVAIGVGLAFGGVLLVLLAGGAVPSLRNLTGDLAIMGSVVCWVAFTIGVRALHAPVSTLRLTALTMITGTPGLLLLGAPDLVGFDWGTVSLFGWVGVAYATLLGIVVAYVLWNNSVRVVGSGRTVIFNAMIPAVAMLAAWPLLGERPSALQVVGGVLIVGGVLASRRTPAPLSPDV